jgi:hypothetical protein
MLDLITVKFLGSYSSKPIYVFGGIGIASALLAVLCGIVVVVQKIAYNWSMNRNALFYATVLLITMTIQFILMGLLAEIMVRTYHESQDRPTYVIRQKLEHAEPGEVTADD